MDRHSGKVDPKFRFALNETGGMASRRQRLGRMMELEKVPGKDDSLSHCICHDGIAGERDGRGAQLTRS